MFTETGQLMILITEIQLELIHLTYLKTTYKD